MELTTKEAVKILERAAELVDQGWAQNAGARDRHRNAVEATSPTAERWCLSGALARARYELSGTTELTEWSLLLGVICRVTAPKCHDLVDWNDAPGRRSHHVSGALRKAAEKLASEAAMNKYLRFHQTCSTEHLTMAEAIEMPWALVRTILDHAESSPQPVEASTRMSESPVFDNTKYAIDKPTIDALKASLQDSGPP